MNKQIIFTLLILCSFVLINSQMIPVSAKNDNVRTKTKNQDLFLETDELTVKFEGANPHAKVFLSSNNDTEQSFFKIIFKSIEEIDNTGKKVPQNSISALERENFENSVEEMEGDDGEYIKISFYSTLDVSGSDVVVKFHFYVFDYAYEEEIGNATTGETVEVEQAAEVKFDIEIRDWPFAKTDNKLEMGIRLIAVEKVIKTQTNGTESEEEVEYEDQEDQTLASGEDSYICFPSLAEVDNETVEIDREIRASGNQQHIFLTFPYFEDVLYYDPVMGIDSTIFTTTNILVIGGIVLIVIIVFVKQKK
ncbi:MAG: hypothetical protein INQ03_12925 [Candidatus Heimdallarchaeota archaeon]|nr:hypothetical protein [Candidatus Heimdallarchaeota archaeon]